MFVAQRSTSDQNPVRGDMSKWVWTKGAPGGQSIFRCHSYGVKRPSMLGAINISPLTGLGKDRLR